VPQLALRKLCDVGRQAVRVCASYTPAQPDWLAGMGNLPLTPERMLKHIALVVNGEAEVRALLEAGMEEDPKMWDGEEKIPDPDKLQDIICPLCQ